MTKNILIIGELNDYIKSIKRHYSFTKGFGIATGFSKISKCYYLTTGESKIYNNVELINIKLITIDFLENIDLILLIREFNILEIMKQNKALETIFLKENRKQIIGMKSDSLNWIFSHIYTIPFDILYNKNWFDFLINSFNFFCVQTEEYKQIGLNLIKRKRPNKYDNFKNKIFISRMGVFTDFPLNNNIQSPYDINHTYCRDDFSKINNDKALHPLCYTLRNINYTKGKGKKYNTQKIKIIYMGRIRTDGGKIAWMMRDIMKELGEDYELHIFPGRFCIPNSNVSVFSSKYPSNLQILRDTIFFECKNVIIHFPFDDISKGKYLQFADIGLDFSSTRPHNKICPAGNAKLLEYCNYGLKVITEKNVNNSYLVNNGKNGILLKGIATVDDYVKGIKELVNMNYDRNFAINITIKQQNWNIIAQEMFNYIFLK